MPDLYSRPFNPDPDKCCSACVWGKGKHAEWCRVRLKFEAETDLPMSEEQLDKWVEQWVEP